MLHEASEAIEISVSDTGIGIPQDKQKLIFEAFQQADGTTSRKYGGTGLGLSISREIARLLGGELQVRSVPGEGSTFTLFVPLAVGRAPHRLAGAGADLAMHAIAALPAPLPLPDDRANLEGKPFVLIVEDDPTFAGILLDLAHGAGLKGVISSSGSGTVAMVRKMQPTAITLDLGLSDIDGFVLLDLLATIPTRSAIPVHVISGAEQAAHALTLGAAGVTEKPADSDVLAELFEGIAETAKARAQEGQGRAPRAAPGNRASADPRTVGQPDPHHRRRHPQHLLADQRARGA